MPAIINTVRPYKNGKSPKVKTFIEANFNALLAEKMSANFPDVIDAMTAMAKGYQETKILTDGTIKVDKSKPDVQAGKLLFEYTLQKPTQKVEHSGGMGILHMIADIEQHANDSLQGA